MQRLRKHCLTVLATMAVAQLALALPRTAQAQTTKTAATAPKPDFPPYASVMKGYEKVVSTADGQASFYTLWIRKKDGQMLAELPKTYASQKQFIAMTVSSGEQFAGLQAGDMYVYWRRHDKQLALITPNLKTRSTGDDESKSSVKRLFTDRVVLAVPIVTIGTSGTPVIDMDSLLVANSSLFFGSSVRPSSRGMSALATIKKAKAFKSNVEISFEVPTSGGTLKTLHYSISSIPTSTGYKPRKADERIGYFTTSYSDLGKYDDRETRVRYINRWHLEKRDAKLALSPPKNAIVFYIEHTTPVRYRRWVRQGVLAWNKAFEKIGIIDAIEVRYQDAATKTFMDLDPEDVNYNFVRWLNNDVGTAIGPSRVNPLTGQILDADIVLTDGWIRHYKYQFNDVMPQLAMQGFSPKTLAWLAQHPSWDPRIRLAAPSQRQYLTELLARKGAEPYAGHALANVDATLIGDDEFDGLIGRTSQVNGMCLASQGKAFDAALMKMHVALLLDDKKDDKKDDKDKKDEPKKKTEPQLDGMPEAFVGPLLANLVAHEVGHTLGLRHNFKGSSTYTLAEINSKKFKGTKSLASSVMDYSPVNIRYKAGEIQGDYTMLGIGEYDLWAIEYGYTFDKDLKPILNRVSEPALQYGTDEDTMGADPFSRRYDFSKNPLDYAVDQVELAKMHRGRILEKFVKDGDSWARARRGYEITLSLQMRTISMMANWLGGTFVRRDKKGDKGDRAPLETVPAKDQRAALKFVIDNTFSDDSFGLTPKLLAHLSANKWLDAGYHGAFDESTWPVHDRVLGIQSSTLTMLMKPTTLERIYDNEFRTAADADALTLPELMETIQKAIWTELNQPPKEKHTVRKPLISSLRRNLQREHLTRLIDLYLPGNATTTAHKPVSNLAGLQLAEIHEQITRALKDSGDKADPYTRAHLTESGRRVKKALDSQYIYNANAIGGSGIPQFIFGQTKE